MLLNLRTVEPFGSGRPLQALLGVLVAAMIGGLVLALAALLHPELGGVLPGAEETGTALTIGRALVGSHLFVFEFISLLLVAAIVGAVYLTKKELR
jgi:NADH:ubiquinone oxidoreductase subunit 6 (subunit J)